MIYSGLDWSGDPGNPARRHGASSLLIAVVVSLSDDELPALQRSFDRVRASRRLPEGHAFQHVTSKRGVREAFFDEIVALPLLVHARIVEKREWTRTYLDPTDGLSRTVDVLIDLICCCPDEIVANQVLFVDLDRGATRELRIIRTSFRRALHGIGRRSFENVKALPDHLEGAELIQAADMVAGELRDYNGERSPLLNHFGKRLVICGE